MVDERIIAILPHRESIIDALLVCLCESAAVVHVILISSAFFDSLDEQSGARAQAIRNARCCDAHVRVAPQQLVSNSRNPRFIERGR
jgi:hypothetical protein